VTHDPGIFEEGVGALENVEVGAADADRLDIDRDPPLVRHGQRPTDQFEAPGLGADDRPHVACLRVTTCGCRRL